MTQLCEHGFAKYTIRAVCMVSLKTIPKYYEHKREIFHDLAVHDLDFLNTIFDERPSQVLPFHAETF